MDISFSQLCHDRQLCIALRKHIDMAGTCEQSYEFSQCRMPEGCSPARVCLGFFRRSNGTYVLYWRPQVIYRGTSRVLDLWFRQCLWSFDSYELLTARLHSLRIEIPLQKHADARYSSLAATLHTQQSSRKDLPALPARIPAVRTLLSPWPSSFITIRNALTARVIGQEQAVEAVSYYLCTHINKVSPAHPLSLILHGPTGVGKSELGKSIAPLLAQQGGDPWQFVWTELNTFTQAHCVHRLTGAPPGYVGYEDEPILSAVRNNPRTIFMFDELDKAHPDVWKIFMSILDEGRCSINRIGQDGRRELDFRKCIFLFTTNLNLSESFSPTMGFTSAPQVCLTADNADTAATPEELVQRLFVQSEIGRKALIRQGVLQEITGRFTGFVRFYPLSNVAQSQILAQKAISFGSEYGLCIADITPEALLLLLPSDTVSSIRAAINLMEVRLTPVYQQAAGEISSATQRYRLVCVSNTLALDPEPPTVSG